MSRITDYGFLFQTTFGTSKTNLINNIQLSQMNSSSVQKQLKAAGIDTNSKKYKAALSEMMKNGNGAMFTNVQAIKNLMSQFYDTFRFFSKFRIYLQFSICIRLIYHFNFLCFFQIDVFISDPVSVFYICDKTLSGFAGHIWKINFFIGSSQ